MSRVTLYDGPTGFGIGEGATGTGAGIEDMVRGFIAYFPAAGTALSTVVVDLTDTTFGLGKSFKTAAADAAAGAAVGVLRDAVAAGSYGFVQTHGPLAGVLTDTTVASGEALMPDAATAGALTTGVVGTDRIVAYALADDVGSAVTAWLSF